MDTDIEHQPTQIQSRASIQLVLIVYESIFLSVDSSNGLVYRLGFGSSSSQGQVWDRSGLRQVIFGTGQFRDRPVLGQVIFGTGQFWDR